jgi:alpha-1,2-mannosyltransferase
MAARTKTSPWELLGLTLFVALLVGTLPVALRRMTRGHSDFDDFYQAGRSVLEHHTRAADSILAYYWPSLDVAWTALAWMPFHVAAVVWYVVSVGTWLGLLRTIHNHLLVGWPDRDRRQATLGTGLLLMPLALNHFCLGSFHILMLWLMVAGLSAVATGRWCRGGLLLGLAIWIKLLPVLAAGYLLWKRQWRPALLAVLTAVTLDAGLSLLGLGPTAAWNAHVRWWHKQVHGTTAGLMNSPYPTPEYRSNNQSLPAVLRRTLTITWVEEPDGRANMYSLAQLSSGQLTLVYRGILVLLGGALAVACWGPATGIPPSRSATELALVCLATVWFSPVAWSYHFLSLTPAMALILVRERRARLDVWALIALWMLALALLGSHEARSHGELLLTSAILAVGMWRLATIRPVAPGRGLSVASGFD